MIETTQPCRFGAGRLVFRCLQRYILLLLLLLLYLLLLLLYFTIIIIIILLLLLLLLLLFIITIRVQKERKDYKDPREKKETR